MSLRKVPVEGENSNSVAGERIKVEYQKRYDERGLPYLARVGTSDLQEYINSHEPSVNVNNIMRRFEMGDATALEKVQGFYDDVSELPNKLQDVLNLNQTAKRGFSELPQEVRDLYNNNYMELLNDPKRMEQLYKKVDEPVSIEEPVKAQEVIANDQQEQ